MKTENFTTTILVDQAPRQVYEAINNVRGWWSEEIEGSTDKQNDVFRYHYEDVHHCQIKVTELDPGKRVAWHVLDNYFNFTHDPAEWKDTNIIFDICSKDGKTEVRFTHVGLVPAYECYEACHQGWTHYIKTSLYNLVTTGEGNPNKTGNPQTEKEKELTGN